MGAWGVRLPGPSLPCGSGTRATSGHVQVAVGADGPWTRPAGIREGSLGEVPAS